MTRDPATSGGLPPWWGSLSLAALALWVCAASVCLFGAWLLRHRGQGGTERTQFLLATGMLALAAATDDGLQIHEYFFPIELGLPEVTLVVVWLVVIGAWVARFHGFLMRSDVLMFGLTAFAFSASLIVDGIDDFVWEGDKVTAYEDYFKLVGLATFAWYCWHEAFRALTEGPTR